MPDRSVPDRPTTAAAAVPVGVPAAAVVDLDAIAGNVAAMRAHAPGAEVMAVVKADAYGHGLVPAARAAQAGGATWLGTAQLSEALALRHAGVAGRILTWLHVPGVDFIEAVSSDVDVSASGVRALDGIASAARSTGRTARVHLKVDSGLGRNGAYGSDFDDLLAAARRLEAEGAVSVVGVWSHLACADEPGHPSVRQQQEVFAAALGTAEAAGCRLEVRHLANSAATLTAPSTHYDLVRLGITAYGLSPLPQLAGPEAYGLTPAMSLVARLALVKRVPAGQGVSYGYAYTTPTATVLGLVPLGYGDGIPRNASNVGPLSVGGRPHVIAGRVCMDQVVVDLGPDSPAQAGDEVVLFGADPAGPTAQGWADATGTISYEIVTRIGPRVPRVHVGTAGTAMTTRRRTR